MLQTKMEAFGVGAECQLNNISGLDSKSWLPTVCVSLALFVLGMTSDLHIDDLDCGSR
jgi:hypothetical protein